MEVVSYRNHTKTSEVDLSSNNEFLAFIVKVDKNIFELNEIEKSECIALINRIVRCTPREPLNSEDSTEKNELLNSVRQHNQVIVKLTQNPPFRKLPSL